MVSPSPGNYHALRFVVPSRSGDDTTTRGYSVSDRVGFRNVTSGTTLGKHNYAAYAAFPDPESSGKVKVLGYQQLYYIWDQPKCCKVTLELDAFKTAFEGKYLFSQVDHTWTKVNGSTYEKIGKGDVGQPCRPSEHSAYYVDFDPATSLPVSTSSKSVSVDHGEPGSRPQCSIRNEHVSFTATSSDVASIVADAAKAKAKIVKLCGTSPNNQCYF